MRYALGSPSEPASLGLAFWLRVFLHEKAGIAGHDTTVANDAHQRVVWRIRCGKSLLDFSLVVAGIVGRRLALEGGKLLGGRV